MIIEMNRNSYDHESLVEGLGIGDRVARTRARLSSCS
jgi:hypothetical protein